MKRSQIENTTNLLLYMNEGCEVLSKFVSVQFEIISTSPLLTSPLPSGDTSSSRADDVISGRGVVVVVVCEGGGCSGICVVCFGWSDSGVSAAEIL